MSAEPEAADAVLEPEGASPDALEDAEPEPTPDEVEVSPDSEGPGAASDDTADTVMGMPALPVDDEAGGTLTMVGLSDEAIEQAREHVDAAVADESEDQSTQTELALAEEESNTTQTVEAPAPKRKGRKSRKAKKKKS